MISRSRWKIDETVVSQGLNGAVFALLALNAQDPQANKDGEVQKKYLDYILEQEKSDGGFSLDDNATEGDVDLTAMTLQCLEPYQEEENVKDTIDRGVEVPGRCTGCRRRLYRLWRQELRVRSPDDHCPEYLWH